MKMEKPQAKLVPYKLLEFFNTLDKEEVDELWNFFDSPNAPDLCCDELANLHS